MATTEAYLQNIELPELALCQPKILEERAEEVELRWKDFEMRRIEYFCTWYQLYRDGDPELHQLFLDFLTARYKQEVKYTLPPGSYERHEEMIKVGSIPVSVMTCFDANEKSGKPGIWYSAGKQREVSDIEASLLTVEPV